MPMTHRFLCWPLETAKTKTARLWTYVRDDRPSGSAEAPAVWFAYSPDRKSEHPVHHLATFRGRMQADAFPGFNQLYERGVTEIACWACTAQVSRSLRNASVADRERGA